MFNFFKKKMPSVSLTYEVPEINEEEFKHSPDIVRLEQREFQLLFVYDHMMTHRRDNSLINEEGAFVANVSTKERFTLWKKNLGKESYPIALPPKEETAENLPRWYEGNYRRAYSAPVLGELWAVRSSHFCQLDNHKENGIQFYRRRVPLLVRYRQMIWTKQYGLVQSDLLEQQITAHMYVGVPSFWEDQLDGGFLFSPVKLFTPRNPELEKYYYYSKLEDNNV